MRVEHVETSCGAEDGSKLVGRQEVVGAEELTSDLLLCHPVR
jgi:hypothetical protein